MQGKIISKVIILTALFVLFSACSNPKTPEASETQVIEILKTEAPTLTPTDSPPPPIKRQIVSSITQENLAFFELSTVEILTAEDIQLDPLLSNSVFQDGIEDYIQELRADMELSEENSY